MDKKVTNVALYIRVSTSKQAQEGYSLEGQKAECMNKAKEQFGEDINVEFYVDEGISAKSTKNRHALNQMMRNVMEGKLDAVVTYKVSRLSRNLSDSLKLVSKIHNANVKFISVKEGEYGQSHKNLQFNILSAVAEYQREELAENVQMGMTQNAKEGNFNGGQMLGYQSINKKLHIVPEEAETVKIIFDKYVNEHWGTKKIANYLNKIGKRTKKNNHFVQSSVNLILKNPAYKGYIRFNQVVDWEKKRRKGKNPNPIVVKGNHEPIIDEATWEKAQALLKQRSTGTPRQYTGNFPLTSIAKCPECGSYMTSSYSSKRKDGTKRRYYTCGLYHNGGRSLCNPNTVNADKLEEAVFERLSNALRSDEMIDKIVRSIKQQIAEEASKTSENKDLAVLENRINNLELQKKRIQEDVITNSGFFTPEEAKERIMEIREEVNGLKKSLITLKKETVQSVYTENEITPDLVRQQIKEFLELKELLDIMEFRQLLVASIEKIEIGENKKLKHVHFSFITHIPESENPRNSSLHSKITKNSPLILRGLYFKENRYLFVVRFSPMKCAEN